MFKYKIYFVKISGLIQTPPSYQCLALLSMTYARIRINH